MKAFPIQHRSRFIVVATAVVLASGVGVGVAVDRVAFAQTAQQPGIKRTILQRADDPGSTTHEAIMAIAEIPAGAVSGKHRHHGIELAYVLEGTVVVEHEGQAPMTLKAGDAFKNDGGVHNARNVGKTPVKILTVYLVEKGKPLAEPVPAAPKS